MTPKFPQSSNSFHSELRNQVNNYFTEKGIKPKGNSKLYSKAIILITSYIFIYSYLVFYSNTSSLLLNLTACIMLGALAAAIGFNVMHDGAHGSFSEHKWLNEAASLSLNFLGANAFMWKTKHNFVHHTYTNIEGADDDLNTGSFLRLCETQKWYKAHQFQHIYFMFIYATLYFYWVFYTDYKKYFQRKVALTPLKKMYLSDHINFWGFKLFHILAFVALPIYTVGFMPWLIGFSVYCITTGIILSVVFQLAHAVEDTQFPVPDSVTMKVEDEWAVHQLKTTANFATQNKLLSWYTGGLNYQVEHHLLSNISHVHYPAISKIVKSVCAKHGIPYIEYSTFGNAFAAHFSHIKSMGKSVESNVSALAA